MSFIDPPRRMPLLLRPVLAAVERRMGKKLLASRILTWYPKALIGSAHATMESSFTLDTGTVIAVTWNTITTGTGTTTGTRIDSMTITAITTTRNE